MDDDSGDDESQVSKKPVF